MVYRYVMPGIESNMYILIREDISIIVDPNENEAAITLLKDNNVRSVLVLLTHEHYDHISGVNRFREEFKDIKVICSIHASENIKDPNKNLAKFHNLLLMDKPKEQIEAGMAVCNQNYSCYADEYIDNNKKMDWNGYHIELILAPGHSKGGMMVIIDDLLFSGDNLVEGAGVICRIPGGNWKIYSENTLPLFDDFSDDTYVFPGHGKSGKLGELRKYLVKFGKEML